MTIAGKEYASLQRTFATRSPVLAVGPGCHRVGYDTTAGWNDVYERVTRIWYQVAALSQDAANAISSIDVTSTRQFLSEFWVSKWSDEKLEAAGITRAAAIGDREFGLPMDGDRVLSDTSKWSDHERLRAALTTLVLVAVRDATQVLGAVIATGRSPVASWHEVGHASSPEDYVPPTDEPPEPQLEQKAVTARSRATDALGRAADLAEFTARLATGDTPSHSALSTAEAFRFQNAEADEDLCHMNMLLKLSAVASSLRALHDNYFEPGREITGGMIEWLGDLLWHLIATDSRVPPALDELAFYLNLSDAPDRPRASFTRTIPGEGTGPLDRGQIHDEVRCLLQAYDSGAEPWSDISDARRRLVRTLAATHLTAWHKADEKRQAYWDQQAVGNVQIPVAIVSDYDLSVERAILEMLPEGKPLHMVVPAWRGDLRDPDLEWLWVTVRRQRGKTVHKSDLIEPDENAWRQFRSLPGWLEEDDSQAVEGPIVVKIHGSPLLHLTEKAQQRLMNPHPGQGQRLTSPPRLATIFTEYDALRAMVSFTTSAGDLSTNIVEGLTWSTRSWVMLGERFPDWLPRVRLLLSARTRFVRDAQPRENGGDRTQTHIAIDRAFDWPERALLAALDVDPYEADLSRLTAYPTQKTTASSDPDVEDFLDAVEAWLRGAR